MNISIVDFKGVIFTSNGNYTQSHQCPNALSSWNPNKRYADSITSWDGTVSEHFQNEIEFCWEKIIKMNIDGII